MCTFAPIALSDCDRIQAYFDKVPVESSDLTFASLYLWRGGWPVCVCEKDGIMVIKGCGREGTHYLYPILAPEAGMEKIAQIVRYFLEKGEIIEMRSVPRHYFEALDVAAPGVFTAQWSMDYADYVYEAADLQNLSGKRYHGKKNHVNRFLRDNPHAEYRRLKAGDEEKCLALFDSWSEDKSADDAARKAERRMIEDALSLWEKLDLRIGVIERNGEIIAFSIAEKVRDMLIVHTEKASGEVSGAFPAINQFFSRDAGADCRWINREEDMGLEGLRASKQSYHPARMIEKAVVRLA